ncbi:MAG: PTS sugar transporter subunit IIC [Gemmatimonadota bacterium]|nr:PTS sugar transporter subunit IIC [Gemmatimonadota bacterium]
MEIIQLSLLGGLLALDGTSVGQFMFSRPLVAGALVGWLLGDPLTGVAVGTILELYLLVSFPTGGSRFPEGATATVVAVAATAVTDSAGALPLAVAVGLVWGQLAGLSVTLMRQLNSRLVPEPGQRSSSPRDIWTAHLGAVLVDFARGALVTFLGVIVGRAIVGGLQGPWALSPAGSVGLLLVGGAASVGILLRDLGGFRRRRTVFVAGVALGIIGARFL